MMTATGAVNTDWTKIAVTGVALGEKILPTRSGQAQDDAIIVAIRDVECAPSASSRRWSLARRSCGALS
jgi:hypothetical protein